MKREIDMSGVYEVVVKASDDSSNNVFIVSFLYETEEERNAQYFELHEYLRKHGFVAIRTRWKQSLGYSAKELQILADDLTTEWNELIIRRGSDYSGAEALSKAIDILQKLVDMGCRT